jgi:hypothetical protein
MRLPNFIYDWIVSRGRIPKLIHKLYPSLHWCYDWDDMLVYDKMDEYESCGHKNRQCAYNCR